MVLKYGIVKVQGKETKDMNTEEMLERLAIALGFKDSMEWSEYAKKERKKRESRE